MNRQEITEYIEELNDELRIADVKGEICLYGGAVMCLVYDARPATKDVDAIFKPARQIREAVKKVADKHLLKEDWLNDAVKGFVVPHKQTVYFNLSNLKVYVPEPDYLLAMKTLSARVDATDKGDIKFMIEQLNIKNAEEVFSILEKYYPRRQIKPATQFFVEELFESK